MLTTIRTSIGARIETRAGARRATVHIATARIGLRSPVSPGPHREGVLSAAGSGSLVLVATNTVSAALNATGSGGTAFGPGATISAVLAATGVGSFTGTNLTFTSGVLSASGVSSMAAAAQMVGSGALAASGAGAAALAAQMTVAAVFSAAGTGTAEGVSSTPIVAGVLSGSGSGAMAGVGRMTYAAVLAATGAGSLADVGRAIRASVLAGSGTGSAALVKDTPSVTVDFINRTPYASAVSPADATATYKVGADGIDYSTGESNRAWLTVGLNSDVQIMAEYNSGGFPSGTLSTWLTPTSDLIWELARTANIAGVTECELGMSCRRVSDSVVIDTWLVNLTAETT